MTADTKAQAAPAAGGSTAASDRFNRRRDAFIDAATEIMNLDGVSGMTLADVASRLGMTTPSVRYYFRKKEDLAAACLLRAIERFDAMIDEAAREASPAARLSRFVGLYLELLRKTRLNEAPPIAHFSEIRTLVAQGSEAVAAAYYDLFRRMRGLFRTPEFEWMGRDERNLRTHLILAIVVWVPAWISRYDPEDHATIAERISDALLHGFQAGLPGPWTPPARLPPFIEPPQDNGKTLSSDLFLSAATQLINDQGYRGASIEKIATHLGVTKGAFYHHHEAKDDVVVACFQRTYDIVERAQRAAIELPGTGWDRLAAVSCGLAEFQFSAQGPLLSNAAISALPEQVARRMMLSWDRVSDRFTLMISQGMIDGSIRPMDASVAAQVVNAGINAAVRASDWAPHLDLDPSGVGPLYIAPMLRGVFSR